MTRTDLYLLLFFQPKVLRTLPKLHPYLQWRQKSKGGREERRERGREGGEEGGRKGGRGKKKKKGKRGKGEEERKCCMLFVILPCMLTSLR